MLRSPATALGEQLRRQQELLSASSRPFPSPWAPSNGSSAAGNGSAAAGGEEAAAGGGRERGGGGGGAEGGGGGGRASRLEAWDVALCATGTAVAGENALVLAALCYAPGVRAPAFLLLGSLALADLLAGLGLVGHFGVQHVLEAPGEAAALGSACLLLTAASASLGSALAITLDRYLSLCHALTYPAERAPGLTAALLVVLWAACAGSGLLPLLGWNCLRDAAACSVLRPVTKAHAAALAVAVLLLFALRLLLDLQICKIAVRHAQQIAVQRQLAAPHATSTRKGLATLALTLGTCALCWLPFAIYVLVADATYPPVYTYSLALLAACSSLINPIVYAFRNPDIQKALWLACCCCCGPAGFPSRPRTSSDV